MELPFDPLIDVALRSWHPAGAEERYLVYAAGAAWGLWKYRKQVRRNDRLERRLDRLESTANLAPMFPLITKKTTGYSFMVPTFYTAHHLGQDYSAPKGTALFAPFDGEIVVADDSVWARYTAQMGVSIHLRFVKDGQVYIMRFAHLNPGSLKVKKGDRVSQGDRLADTGNTGLSTGPHLHIDISRDSVDIKNLGNFVDPQKFSFDAGSPVKIENAIEIIPAGASYGVEFKIRTDHKANARNEPRMDDNVYQVLAKGSVVKCSRVVSGDTPPGETSDQWYKSALHGKYIHVSTSTRL